MQTDMNDAINAYLNTSPRRSMCSIAYTGIRTDELYGIVGKIARHYRVDGIKLKKAIEAVCKAEHNEHCGNWQVCSGQFTDPGFQDPLSWHG